MNIGIDVGSTAVKIVFLEKEKILWKKSTPTIPGQGKLVNHLIAEGLNALSINESDIGNLSVTGYGRKLISKADNVINEIAANALGAHLLSSAKAQTIINIGGQDIKIIKISKDGKVMDFKMNDKCAAGTGRFFEMAARILDTPVSEFGDLSLVSDSPVSINSTCAVFAESEIVSMLANGEKKENIVKGLHESVANRISNIIGSMELDEFIFIDGGPAANSGLADCIKEKLLYDIHILNFPQFTVAYGAAMS